VVKEVMEMLFLSLALIEFQIFMKEGIRERKK
jgi:hypothetical protein